MSPQRALLPRPAHVVVRCRWLPSSRGRDLLPLLALLNPQVPPRTLAARLREMRQRGYRCAGAYRERTLVGIAGVWLLCKAYVGRHAEVDNVVIDPSLRQAGVGAHLIRWIEAGRGHGAASRSSSIAISGTGEDSASGVARAINRSACISRSGCDWTCRRRPVAERAAKASARGPAGPSAERERRRPCVVHADGTGKGAPPAFLI